jgi:type II restriction enzyme
MDVRAGWQVAVRTLEGPHQARGWLADALRVVDSLPQRFTLGDVYGAKANLARLHPGNRNVRAKIRQQLQVLRDRGMIRFVAPGEYERLPSKSIADRGGKSD